MLKYFVETLLILVVLIAAVLSGIASDFKSLRSIVDAKMLNISDSFYYSKSGEAYAVAPDKTIIGKSRFPNRIERAGGLIDTTATNTLLEGSSGSAIINDYGGVPVLSVWRVLPDNKHGAAGIIAEVNLSESIRKTLFPAIISLFIVGLGYFTGYRRNSKVFESFDFRSIIRSFPDGLLFLRNSKTGVIMDLNTKAAKALGYTLSSEIVGKQCSHIFDRAIPCTEGPCTVVLKHKDETTTERSAQVINVKDEVMLIRILEEN